MIASFYGNLKTTLIVLQNVSDENDVEEDFYESFESLTRRIPKQNLLIIGGDFDILGKKDSFTSFYHYGTNPNGSKMKDYLQTNEPICLNTTFSKRPGQQCTIKLQTGA